MHYYICNRLMQVLVCHYFSICTIPYLMSKEESAAAVLPTQFFSPPATMQWVPALWTQPALLWPFQAELLSLFVEITLRWKIL